MTETNVIPMERDGVPAQVRVLANVLDTSEISIAEAAEILARVGWHPGWNEWAALSDDVKLVVASAMVVIATATDEEAGQVSFLLQDDWGTA